SSMPSGANAKALLADPLDRGSQLSARAVQPRRDPLGIGARGEPREAVVEAQPVKLEPRVLRLDVPDGEQAEIVAKVLVDRIVVEGVTEVVRDDAPVLELDPVED